MTWFDGSVNGVRRAVRTRSLVRGPLAILALAGCAFAQILPGDLLLNVNGSPSTGTVSRVTCFHPDGTPVWTTTGGSGNGWLGCAITPQGHVITARRYPVIGVDVFDSGGVQITTFDTSQVSFAGDVSVFADGTLAITDQVVAGADLYTEAGLYVASFDLPGALTTFGSFIDSSDNLWLCDGASLPGRLYKLSRAGVLLANIPVLFAPGDMVVAPDGTLWVTSQNDGRLYHLAAGGSILSFFPTNLVGTFCGIALANDGSLFVTAEVSPVIYQYSSTGTLLNTIPIGGPSGAPLFLTIRRCMEPTVYCTAKTNSLGCVPSISSTGLPSASMTSGFVVRGANVRNNKSGLLFYGTNGRSMSPFQGGTLCVQTPLRRTGAANSGGAAPPANDCSGVFAIDMNAFAHSTGPPPPLSALTVPGTTVNCQWWGRDPGFPAPSNTTLTDAMEYVVCL